VFPRARQVEQFLLKKVWQYGFINHLISSCEPHSGLIFCQSFSSSQVVSIRFKRRTIGHSVIAERVHKREQTGRARGFL